MFQVLSEKKNIKIFKIYKIDVNVYLKGKILLDTWSPFSP